MTGIELVKINRKSMELMSMIDLKASDYKYVELFDAYVKLRGDGEKYSWVVARLSELYSLSESSVKRVIRRFSREVTV